MSERRSQRFVLQLGAAFTVTASLSFADIAANAAAPHEKVLALRAAAQSGLAGGDERDFAAGEETVPQQENEDRPEDQGCVGHGTVESSVSGES